MTGNSFGDVVPFTITEITYSVGVMVLGAIFYAIIFANFESLMTLYRAGYVQKKKKYELVK